MSLVPLKASRVEELTVEDAKQAGFNNVHEFEEHMKNENHGELPRDLWKSVFELAPTRTRLKRMDIPGCVQAELLTCYET